MNILLKCAMRIHTARNAVRMKAKKLKILNGREGSLFWRMGGKRLVFSSLVFLYGFLPAVLIAVFLCPPKGRNLTLLLCSLFFYGWGEPVLILLMILSFSLAYLFGFFIARNRISSPRRAKGWMILSVSVTLSFLFFFKYYNFAAANLSKLSFLHLPILSALRLPIGISFYTFQILSYTVDLYRGDAILQKNYIAFGTYVSLFPQLIAGPIVRYREIDRELQDRRVTVSDFADGVGRFCAGLSKKVLLGDPLAESHFYYRNLLLQTPDTLSAWMCIVCYTLHLYFDFSGYSDMAIGLGRMFGFHFPENFNYPYLAGSITEFWRRWHITLSSWFREYVYIPLGGNRQGKGKQLRNLTVVWLLTGLWHGASWNFLLWGAYFLLFLVLEHFVYGKYLSRLPYLIRLFYTMVIVCVSFLIFSETDLSIIGKTMQYLIGAGCPVWSAISVYQAKILLPLLLLAILGATPIPKLLFDRLSRKNTVAAWVKPVFCTLSLWLSTAYLTDASFSPFEYLNF